MVLIICRELQFEKKISVRINWVLNKFEHHMRVWVINNNSFSLFHTSLSGRKEACRQKSKQSFQNKIMKSRIHCHQRNPNEMKAEVFTFQSTYVLLHTNIHEPWNINFKRRWKYGTSAFSAIQNSVFLISLYRVLHMF